MNIAALLFDVARRQGELPAVSDAFDSWTYREFARRIAALADGLAARGLGRASASFCAWRIAPHFWRRCSPAGRPGCACPPLSGSGVRGAADPGNLGNLRTIVYGGGPMYVSDLERALQIFGPRLSRLYQLYGQGESPMTIAGLSQRRHAEAGAQGRRDRLASCGVPRTGILVRIVDEEDRELPPGMIGEVVTDSDCVMEGYWRNPTANAETLRGGWLHTGDLGSPDEDGFLTLRDRAKDMIISGGSNIYPREIEEVLLRHPDLVEAAVVGRPHPEWGEEVVAFVVRRPGAAIDAPALDQLCLSRIARYKRPRDYRFVDGLPKNNYGKAHPVACSCGRIS